VRSSWLIGGLVAAGAAIAATTFVTLTRSTDEAPADAAAAPPPAPAAAETAAPALSPLAAPRDSAPRATSVELVEIPLAIVPIARRPPDYPPDALARRLEGHVQLKFDVTTAGRVENLSVVESSDPIFEESAVRAVTTWRYLPKIAAGKRVVSPGIQTVIRFEPGNARPPATAVEQLAADNAAGAAQRSNAEFSAGLETALDRFAADDLRSAELQLYEMYAVYDNDARRSTIWNFYGYLFTVAGNYDRAIDAYESAIAANRGGSPTQNQWVSLASLYFARHQYDMALRTLLGLRDRIAELQAQYPERPRWPMAPEVESFIDRLRALGVTEETLPAR
jgi:TonB family protein